jgi:hypothetical protein
MLRAGKSRRLDANQRARMPEDIPPQCGVIIESHHLTQGKMLQSALLFRCPCALTDCWQRYR